MNVCSISFLTYYLLQKIHISLSLSLFRYPICKTISFFFFLNKLTLIICAWNTSSVRGFRENQIIGVTFGEVTLSLSKRPIPPCLDILQSSLNFLGYGSLLASKSTS